ncbi:MAG: DUF3793 family protein [Lachnospiraceae bacterium]
MSAETIVKNCSPTLAGIKTGSMFACSFKDKEEMQSGVRYWNCLLNKKGLRVLPLRYENGTALIYIYRPSHLGRDLKHQTASRLLQERGYQNENPGQCVWHLMMRLRENKEFPHEIGLFLGYPPEDVLGFIENKAKNCKCTGCWKVYGDEAVARDTFEKYRKCTALYYTQFVKGMSVECLTVAD